ncbi:MAG: hypothetical protein AAF467_08510 [Actinomycetota bacterium]
MGTHVAQTKAAAVGPANERAAGAKAAQVGDMDAAPAGAFDRGAFVAAVEAAIARKAPKTLEDADDMSGSGAMGEVRSEVQSQVGSNTEGASAAVSHATDAAPDPARGSEKAVRPMPPAATPAPPTSVGAAQAMPPRRPASATDMSAEPAAVAGQMKSEGLTEQQLAASEEPQFLDALDAKRAGDAHSRTAPGPVRAAEAQVLAGARAQARQAEGSGLAAMGASRAAADASVVAAKTGSKGRDEHARQQVASRVEAIHATTKNETTAILSGLDGLVDAEFSRGESQARQLFETTHKREMAAWKDDRYSGISGKLKWAKDKIFDPPPEANRIFDRARQLYLVEMRKVIGRVADIVARELTAAKARIARGRAEVAEYVASLPRNLQSVGNELQNQVQARFDALDQDVNSKQQALVQVVADKYAAARSEVDAKVEELKAANRGLWGAAKAKIAAVIDTIRKLKDALLAALAGAASAVATIIANPKRFFSNLTTAIGQGLKNFVANIGGHLRKGLFAWLTGAAGEAGITMPERFDLRGIIGLVLQVLGLTWANIRSRIVKKLGPAGEKVLGRIESGVAILTSLVREGPIALWKLIASKVANLWELVVGKLKEFLITRVIMAGVTWLIGLLNPVAGFIKICKAIVDLVQWFWNNASRLVGLLKAITGSVMAIAKGALGPAAQAVENALSQALPVVIGFLASLLGIGGLGQKVREVITAVRRPVNKVVDMVVGKALSFGRRLLSSGVGRKLVGGVKKGVAYGRKKISQAKAWGERKVQSAKRRVYGGDDSPEGKQKRLQLALDSGARAVNAYAGEKVRRLTLEPKLKVIQLRRGVGYLGVKPAGEHWAVEARIDRSKQITDAKTPDGEEGAEPDAMESTHGPTGHARRDGTGEVLVGLIKPYSADLVQDPRSKKHTDDQGNEIAGRSELKLFREHVIPRVFVDRLFRAMGLTGAPGGGAWYNDSPTVWNYFGSKATKDRSDPGEQELNDMVSHPRWVLDPASGSSPDQKTEAMLRLEQLVDHQALRSSLATNEAVVGEAQMYGTVRGTSDDVRPTLGRIQDAADSQRKTIKDELFRQRSRQHTLAQQPVPRADAVARAFQRMEPKAGPYKGSPPSGGYATLRVELKRVVRLNVQLFRDYSWTWTDATGKDVLAKGSSPLLPPEDVAKRLVQQVTELRAAGR